ncbi:hypothetical protein Tco_1247455 [Tanacetum coccineum]
MPPRIMSSAEDNRLPAVDSPYYTHQDIFPSLIQRRRMRRTLPTILQTRRDDGGRRMRGGHPSILPTLTKEDLYKFVDMVDDAPRHPGCPISRELDYGITDEWDGLMEDARDDRSELRGRVDLLYSDRPIHHHLAVMVEREAWMAREAWDFLMDAADHQNNSVDLKALKLLKGLHTQKAEFQKGRIGTAEGPHSLRFTRGGLKMGTEEEGPQEPRGQGQSPTTPPPVTDLLTNPPLARDTTRNGEDSHSSGVRYQRPVQIARDCNLPGRPKMPNLELQGHRGSFWTYPEWF